MGKLEPQLPLQQQQNHGLLSSVRCPIGLCRIGRMFSFKCVFILLLSVSVFLSAIFGVFPFHSAQTGFEAKEAIKLNATVQVCFRLQRPVSTLVPQIPKLEFDINSEIGVPDTKIAILSMHQDGAPNWTMVVFGVLSRPMNSQINSYPVDVPINAASLSVLRSSLIELFLQQTNMTLTASIFGQPSSFQILKFPGGITVIPKQSASIWLLPHVLFTFTLPNPISEIDAKFLELKEQLKLGLHLKPYENVYVQVTNINGSTINSPVTVQASIMSDLGSLLPQRLKQLAQTITGSPPAKNLGLNHTVFGKVKEISLSSYLNHSLDENPPSPSPAPSPEQNDYADPSVSPSYSPAGSPDLHHGPCVASPQSPNSLPRPSSAPLWNSLPPSVGNTRTRCHGLYCGSNISPSPSPIFHSDPNTRAIPPHVATHSAPPRSPRSDLPPDLPPLPAVSYGSRSGQENGYHSSEPPTIPSLSVLTTSSSSTAQHLYGQAWFFFFFTLTTFHILSWSEMTMI